MEKMRLGRTGLEVCRTGFGALPIQRVDFETAKAILWKAYDEGIDFFDTARGYSDSEEKIGYALSTVRQRIIIATKTPSRDRASVLRDIETSLRMMKTDYIDIIQLHNPEQLPDPEDENSSYAGLVEAQKKGMVRFIGLTNHRLPTAMEAVESGIYDTLQFPLSTISSEEDLAVIQKCSTLDVGVIAMKALCGGLLTNARTAFAFLRQYPHLIPIWGIQRIEELDEFLALEKNPPALDSAMLEQIAQDRRMLAGNFCRGCGYCLPCPADIPIPMAARMSLLLRRAPYQGFMTEVWRENMARIRSCQDCGACIQRCPYALDTPRLLQEMLEDYEAFIRMMQ